MKLNELFKLDNTIARKNIEIKHLDKRLKTKEQHLKIFDTKIYKEKIKIYEEIKNIKIKKGDLISFKTFELDINKDEKGIKGIFNKITNMFNPIDHKYKMLYFGYGRQVRLLDIPPLNSNIIQTKSNELFKYIDHEKPYFMSGKTLIFAKQDTLFLPELDLKNSKLNILNLDPHYLWNLINNVFDNSLTIPSSDGGLLGKGITPKKVIIVLAILGIIFYAMQKQNGG